VDFYNKLRKGDMSATTQITPIVYEEYFRKYVAEGLSIIYIGFSSALSESFNHSVMAKKTILEENQTADITVVDSKCASVGQGLLVYYACEMKKQGKSKEEIAAWVEDTKLKVNHWFTVDSLDHLHRGGRLSATSAAFGTALKIKPILIVDNEGKLIPKDKVRGRQKSINALSQELKSRIVNPEEQIVFISHGDCIEEAEQLKQLVLSKVNVKDIIINYLGPVIGAHTGPGLLCIAFIGNCR
jgi:DegV family protein with EDD domain